MDAQLNLWEVFIQNKMGGEHVHAGSVHASDANMALQNARDVYTRRNEGSSIWVVPTKYIIASNLGDAEMFFDPAEDKLYRHPSFYVMPEGAEQI